MRDFRGKNKEKNIWFFGWFCGADCTDDVEFESELVEKAQIIDNKFLYWHEVDPETVGQGTGMNDKHRHEIYDGDILRFCYPELNIPPTVGKVYYSTKDGGWMISYPGKKFGPDVLDEETAETSEIVGNITDNPELMDKKV